MAAAELTDQRSSRCGGRLLLDQLFVDDVEDLTVYRGYVDDPRNTCVSRDSACGPLLSEGNRPLVFSPLLSVGT